MPFTFSHPAIVLPLNYLPKRWISLTGLVVGSLTPDFEYFLRMSIKSYYSHTLSGLFWFDLPLGILLAFIFHLIVKPALFKNLPNILRLRLLNFEKLNWIQQFKENWLIVMVSILIGSLSHLLWDSFTHENGYFVELIPALSIQFKVFGLFIPLYKVIQHLSSLIGGIVIIFSLLALPKQEQQNEEIMFSYWAWIIGLTLLITFVRILLGLQLQEYGHLIVTGISAFLISITLISSFQKRLNF